MGASGSIPVEYGNRIQKVFGDNKVSDDEQAWADLFAFNATKENVAAAYSTETVQYEHHFIVMVSYPFFLSFALSFSLLIFLCPSSGTEKLYRRTPPISRRFSAIC